MKEIEKTLNLGKEYKGIEEKEIENQIIKEIYFREYKKVSEMTRI